MLWLSSFRLRGSDSGKALWTAVFDKAAVRKDTLSQHGLFLEMAATCRMSGNTELGHPLGILTVYQPAISPSNKVSVPTGISDLGRRYVWQL